jgi:hypothetical protein
MDNRRRSIGQGGGSVEVNANSRKLAPANDRSEGVFSPIEVWIIPFLALPASKRF